MSTNRHLQRIRCKSYTCSLFVSRFLYHSTNPLNSHSFKDGVLSELHAGSNAYKDLANYIQSHLISLPSYSESSQPNPYGEVTQLSDSNFQNYVGNEGDGKIVWIKYFAPWCVSLFYGTQC